jgi:hypothetical protein
MADGETVPISQVQVGDLVAARDAATGALTAQPVLNVIVGVGDKHLITVTTGPAPASAPSPGQVSDPAGEDTWTATVNHPIWIQDRGWTQAGNLHVGDLTIGATGEIRIVQGLDDEGWVHKQTVYNLAVANSHTYIVGDTGDGTLVHNCSTGADRSIGPSGKPKVHIVNHPTRKRAQDAARNDGRGQPMHHPSPERKGGSPHYHPVDKYGNKTRGGVHHNYPRP